MTHPELPVVAWIDKQSFREIQTQRATYAHVVTKCRSIEGDTALVTLESAESALKELREAAQEARQALAAFAKVCETHDERYRSRGGKPDSFPDTHPGYELREYELHLGDWRKARAVLSRLDRVLNQEQGK